MISLISFSFSFFPFLLFFSPYNCFYILSGVIPIGGYLQTAMDRLAFTSLPAVSESSFLISVSLCTPFLLLSLYLGFFFTSYYRFLLSANLQPSYPVFVRHDLNTPQSRIFAPI